MTRETAGVTAAAWIWSGAGGGLIGFGLAAGGWITITVGAAMLAIWPGLPLYGKLAALRGARR